VVAGSYNLAGPVLVRIDKLGRDTRFAQIVALMEQASTEKPRLARLADRIAGPFLVLVLLAAGLSAFYWWQIDPTRALSVAVAVLIVTCPVPCPWPPRRPCWPRPAPWPAKASWCAACRRLKPCPM
jgi:P-type Cu2+ transporter